MKPPRLSVFIPTYNPDASRLDKTLQALRKQALTLNDWELLVIDNASTNDVLSRINLGWHPLARIVREERPGLTYARLKGFLESKADVLVMVDDDNVLHENYLANVLKIFGTDDTLGLAGGKSLPTYDTAPPPWIRECWSSLALRDLGDQSLTYRCADNLKLEFPAFAPIGAGMAMRRAAIEPYAESIRNGKSRITDRIGKNLTSGGDSDLVMHTLKEGWCVGYFPELSLEHLIPAGRMEKNYLARLNFSSSKSWMQVLHLHGICPWPRIPAYTVCLRKAKAFFAYRAWHSNLAYIRWKGACGMYEGLSDEKAEPDG